jgi:FkbM family methyltransferase
MSLLAGGWMVNTARLRSVLRRTGLTRHLTAVRRLIGSNAYEQKVDRALSSLLRPGDCVWDVGANVGLYTERFAKAVGPNGKVVAFEPIASTCDVLRNRVRDFDWVQVRQEALGAKSGMATVLLDDDPTSPTNSLARTPPDGAGRSQSVVIASGDELVARLAVPIPTVVKIDTEGFEEDVLWGSRELLRDPQLRALLIEVHFAILDGRGYQNAPSRLCSLLEDLGFAVRWVDASHLLATRKTAAA